MQFIFSNANEKKKQTLMRGDVHRGPHSVPSGMDPSSTRDQTHIPWIARQILSTGAPGKSQALHPGLARRLWSSRRLSQVVL